MGDVSELSGDLDSIFGLVRAEKVDGMAGVGRSGLGWTPSRTSCGLWTVLRPDLADSRDVTVSL